MRTILIILKKEFRQIFRNRSMLPIIFVAPFLQLLILSNAANFEIKNIKMHVVDFDQSSASRLLISKFQHNDHFTIVSSSFSEEEANKVFYSDEAKFVLEIPYGFEKSLVNESNGKVQLRINSIDGAAAGVISVYAVNIIGDANRELAVQWINFKPFDVQQSININYSFWFNPDLNYKTFMVPGILVMLVTMIGMLLVMPTAVITESKENIKSIKEICKIAAIIFLEPLIFFSSLLSLMPKKTSEPISQPLLIIKNNPPKINKKFLKENPTSPIVNNGSVRVMIHDNVINIKRRITNAKDNPKMRAVLRFFAGNLATTIAIKIKLSIPRTISKNVRVSKLNNIS